MGKIERGERNGTLLNLCRIADALEAKASTLLSAADLYTRFHASKVALVDEKMGGSANLRKTYAKRSPPVHGSIFHLVFK